jgi:hypothetical protein
MSINNGQEKIRETTETITTSWATKNKTNVSITVFTVAQLRMPCFWHMAQCHWIIGSLHFQDNTVSLSTRTEVQEHSDTQRRRNYVASEHQDFRTQPCSITFKKTESSALKLFTYQAEINQTHFCHATIWHNTQIQNG